MKNKGERLQNLAISINIIMEDSRNALFVEPNAYIQKFNKEEKGIKKIVFQEPYECLPNFYIDNNFKKGNCECVLKPKEECFKDNKKNDCCNNKGGFNIQSLLPLLTILGKGGGTDFSQISNLLNGNSNPMNLISTLLSNKDGLSNILKLFKGGGLNLNNKKEKPKLKETDFEIKNYTRVE